MYRALGAGEEGRGARCEEKAGGAGQGVVQCGGSGGDSCLLGCVRGVESLWTQPQWDMCLLPTHLSALRIRQRTLRFTVARNVGASFRYHGEYHLQQAQETRVPDEPDHGLEAGGSSVFVPGLPYLLSIGRVDVPTA